jgi:hypothetical protein
VAINFLKQGAKDYIVKNEHTKNFFEFDYSAQGKYFIEAGS